MIRKQEKELERKFVSAFLQTIGNASVLDPNVREEPDFLLCGPQLIGIEVTRLFSGPDNDEVSRVNIEGGWDGALELALKLWIDSGRPAVDVRIMLNDSFHIPKVRRSKYARELMELVDKYLPEPGKSFLSPDDMLDLPKGIVYLNIYRDEEIESPTWKFNDVIWTPQITIETIQRGITDKEERRKVYLQNCDEIWLLLVLYGRRPSGSFIVPEYIYHSKYQFMFHKVYLFDAIPKHAWELRRI